MVTYRHHWGICSSANSQAPLYSYSIRNSGGGSSLNPALAHLMKESVRVPDMSVFFTVSNLLWANLS